MTRRGDDELGPGQEGGAGRLGVEHGPGPQEDFVAQAVGHLFQDAVAPGTVNVTSMASTPPASRASATSAEHFAAGGPQHGHDAEDPASGPDSYCLDIAAEHSAAVMAARRLARGRGRLHGYSTGRGWAIPPLNST